MERAEKIARNVIKIGRVSSKNTSKGTVEVVFPDRDNAVSSPLPVLESVSFPNVNDQVVCLFLGNALEDGFCLGGFYSSENLPDLGGVSG